MIMTCFCKLLESSDRKCRKKMYCAFSVINYNEILPCQNKPERIKSRCRKLWHEEVKLDQMFNSFKYGYKDHYVFYYSNCHIPLIFSLKTVRNLIILIAQQSGERGKAATNPI